MKAVVTALCTMPGLLWDEWEIVTASSFQGQMVARKNCGM